MKKIYFLTSILLLVLIKTYAQYNVVSDTTAIGLGATSADPAYKFKYNGQSVAYYGLGWYSSASAPIAYLSGYSGLAFFTQGGPKMAILSTGNVGIGTTSPATKLQVEGSVLANNNVNNSFILNSAGVNYGFVSNNAANTWSLGYGPTLTTLGTPVLTWNGSGKVGIGTTTPDEQLSVLGKIHANEVKVDLSVPGPDYVFKPDYKLPTLAEVKAYVDKNHHLAEIPSADEMAKNGLNLGDMNTKLLKKVEELTLYLIEQNKQIAEMQLQIQALKKN